MQIIRNVSESLCIIYKDCELNLCYPLAIFLSFLYDQFYQVKTFKGVHVMNNFLSVVLFNTNKHTYTVGDMISLTSGMIILSFVVFVSLIVGIK